MKMTRVVPEFVEFIPSLLAPGVLYVSIPYATAVHACCCGCGERVVTPLTPTDWAVTYDGETVSLCPSIGNWSFRCQSHYWVTQNQVDWAAAWSRERIDAGRRMDRVAKRDQFSRDDTGEDPTTLAGTPIAHGWRHPIRKLRAALAGRASLS
jgi:hypothetical protein